MAILALGSTGKAVEAWQHALNAARGWVKPLVLDDGIFGPITDEITRECQQRAGLDPDGIVGPNSRRAMGIVGYGVMDVVRAFDTVACAKPKYPVELVADCTPSGWLDFAQITTRDQLAALLAQVAHESGRFFYLKEIWGPTAQQKRYEPVTSLSRSLGNTQKGDGKRYMGRGAIQTTGRSNYRQAGIDLGIFDELELHPALVAEPGMGLLTSAAYWKRTHCNRLATSDPEQFKALTKRINGGYNGHQDRVVLWHKAQRSLGLA